MSLIKRALKRGLTPWLWGHSSAELGLGNVSYSQFGEDLLLRSLFSGKSSGVYIDVGAFHPIYLSNTYALSRQGWSGMAVDANASVAHLYGRFRPKDVFVHSAVGSRSDRIKMSMFEAGAFNCTADHAENVPEQFRQQEIVVEVPMRPLAAILKDREIGPVDFLNVDCEGSDLEILQSNDWSRWRPSVVCVEDHSDEWQKSEVAQYVTGQGYSLKFRAGLSSLFVIHGFQ